MTIGTMFTLFVVPAVYVLIARDHSHERDKEREAEMAAVDELVEQEKPSAAA
jgi:multidrug efflux pump